MDYFKKFERALKVTGNGNLTKDYSCHLKRLIKITKKKPFEIEIKDIKNYLNLLNGNKDTAKNSLMFFYYFILRKDL